MGASVLHVIHSSAFGGGPNMLTILCTRLRGEFDMEVVCDGEGEMPQRLEDQGIAVRRLPLTTKWSFSAHIPQLAALVRRARPDVVHLHGQFAGSLGQLALQVAGRPKSIYTVQWPSYLDDGGPWSRLRNYTAERVSCGGATAVVAVSEHDRRDLMARGLCPARKLTLIYNAYYMPSEPGAPESHADVPVVGFVGRLADQKGCEYLVRAAARVLATHPTARFLIVGDGPERATLESLAQTLGVAKSFDFVGYDAEPARRMAGMSVLAVPSIYEPLGMVVLEAMACGVPVVGSKVGGIPEAVADGKTGLLVPPRDAGALATAIDRLLSDPALAAQMGAAGRQRALETFSPDVIAAQYAELYRRLAARTSS